jgi:glucose-1-phosphate thymidylyltransferase
MSSGRALIGLIPAAGRGTRLAGLAGSKELLAVPGTDGSGRPGPVAGHLLEALARAGVERAYVVLRTGKWDVVEHFTAAPPRDVRLAYLATAGTPSIPASLDLAYPFVRGATVVTGFADSCFTPLDAVGRALRRHRGNGAAVTLALFPSDRPDKTDMVELDGNRVTGLRVKPGVCGLEYTFGAAVWGPEFTDFLHDDLPRARSSGSELQVSEVLVRALEAGLRIDAELSPAGRYIDVGTPEDLARARAGGIET